MQARRRTALVAWVAAWSSTLWGGEAHAQAGAASYAIMTLLADRITMVTYRPGVGSHRDGNRREEVPLPDDSLDGVAAFAADDALRKADPGVKTSLFTTRDARLHALHDQSAGNAELPGELDDRSNGTDVDGARQWEALLDGTATAVELQTVQRPGGGGWSSLLATVLLVLLVVWLVAATAFIVSVVRARARRAARRRRAVARLR